MGTGTDLWHAGLVRRLSVTPLSSWKTQRTALVRWCAGALGTRHWALGTRLSAHRHQGGDGVFVLPDTLEDPLGRSLSAS